MKDKLIKISILFVTALFVVRGGMRANIFSKAGSDYYGVKGEDADFYGKENRESSSRLDSEDSASGEIGEDVRYEIFPIKSSIKDKESYYQFSNEKLAWYMVRKENHEPTGCDETVDIEKYGGYYLDKRYGSNTGDDATPEDAKEKVMYLTFDCGYDNGYTKKMLDVLKEQNVPACFFVTQTYIRDNRELIKRMKEEGHQVGNHTVTHPSMPEVSYEEIIEEVEGCADYMLEATGYAMDPYLRPPMGEYSERILKITQDLGYKSIFWSMAYMDYDVNKQPGRNYVIEHFEKYHHNGAIILMHNVSSSNEEALDTVIKNMKEKGYRFASLNELK